MRKSASALGSLSLRSVERWPSAGGRLRWQTVASTPQPTFPPPSRLKPGVKTAGDRARFAEGRSNHQGGPDSGLIRLPTAKGTENPPEDHDSTEETPENLRLLRMAPVRGPWARLCIVCVGLDRGGKRTYQRKTGPRMSTAARGYGTAHRRLRDRLKPAVGRGEASCARCGRWIPPGGHGPCPAVHKDRLCGHDHHSWDLGHADWDRSKYTGPEHECCNRIAAAIKGNRMRRKAGR